MVSIDVVGGSTEIGGNKIFIEHKGTKIILDFGMSFTQSSKYFSEFLNPRKCTAFSITLYVLLQMRTTQVYRYPLCVQKQPVSLHIRSHPPYK